MRRVLPMFILCLAPLAAQTPAVRLLNLSHPLSSTFQVGDRFEVQVTGVPGQPISVRTVRQANTDWSPVVASTDSAGRWSTTGQFDKSDFGSWSEIWTVGGKLANPVIQFDVKAPCLPAGRGGAFMSGPNVILNCDTAQGAQTFVTPSLTDSFRTPDGRTITGRPAQQTPEQYHMEILNDFITSADTAHSVSLSSARGGLGDETADLISNLIGPNALTEKETRNVLVIIRGAFASPRAIAPDARTPTRTVAFLRHLAELTDRDDLRSHIAETIEYVQTQ